MEKIIIESASSLTTVALAILAVAIFIYYGANALFYATVVVAILVGFLNAWLISKAAPEGHVQKAAVNINIAKKHKARARKKRGTKA